MQENPDTEKKSPVSRFFGGMNLVLLIALLCAILYLAAVLIHADDGEQSGWTVEGEKQAVTPLQAGKWSDVTQLKSIFGAPLPYLPGENVQGEMSNTSYDGSTVRQAVLRYANGITVSAVSPASAAPLLLHEGLDASTRSDLTFLGARALLARGTNEWCLYITQNDAAYAFYGQGMSEEEFFSIASGASRAD